MNTRFYFTIGILFIFVGCLIGSDYIIQYVKNSTVHASPIPLISQKLSSPNTSTNATVPTNTRTQLPIHITVPKTGVSVDIDPGYYDYNTKTWTLSNSRAYFATITTVPNTVSGNTYIYGHNRSNIFTHLNGIARGDIALVTTSDGKVFTYQLDSIRDATPDDDTLINYRGKPILTLQTCAGLFDQYRRLFVFHFVSES